MPGALFLGEPTPRLPVFSWELTGGVINGSLTVLVWRGRKPEGHASVVLNHQCPASQIITGTCPGLTVIWVMSRPQRLTCSCTLMRNLGRSVRPAQCSAGPPQVQMGVQDAASLVCFCACMRRGQGQSPRHAVSYRAQLLLAGDNNTPVNYKTTLRAKVVQLCHARPDLCSAEFTGGQNQKRQPAYAVQRLVCIQEQLHAVDKLQACAACRLQGLFKLTRVWQISSRTHGASTLGCR